MTAASAEAARNGEDAKLAKAAERMAAEARERLREEPAPLPGAGTGKASERVAEHGRAGAADTTDGANKRRDRSPTGVRADDEARSASRAPDKGRDDEAGGKGGGRPR